MKETFNTASSEDMKGSFAENLSSAIEQDKRKKEAQGNMSDSDFAELNKLSSIGKKEVLVSKEKQVQGSMSSKDFAELRKLSQTPEASAPKTESKEPAVEIKRLTHTPGPEIKRITHNPEKTTVVQENKESAAEKMLRLTETLDAEDLVIKQEVEKKGYGEHLKSFGKMYQAMPLKKKLLISAGLMGVASLGATVGGAAGLAIAGAAFTGSMGQRMLGGLATFVALEGFLNKDAEKRGEKVSKRSMILAGTLSGLVGGSVILSSALDGITGAVGGDVVEAATPVEESVFTEGEVPEINLAGTGDVAPTPDRMTMPVTEIRAEAPTPDRMTMPTTEIRAEASTPDRMTMPTTVISAEAPTPDRMTMPTTEISASAFADASYTVQGGESTWSILGGEPALAGLSEAQKTYAVDMLKDKLNALSPDQLREIGISSGDINKLSAGEAVNFASILSAEEIASAAKDAGGLSEASLASIEVNNAVIAEWTAAHPNVPLTDSLIADILGGGEEIVAPTAEVEPEAVPVATTAELTPEMITETNHIITEDINALFGTKGVFGIGAEAGTDSLAWAGLKDQPVEAVLGKQEFGESFLTDTNADEATSLSGIDSPEDTQAMQDYLNNISAQTGVAPQAGETVELFIQRAVGTSVATGQIG